MPAFNPNDRVEYRFADDGPFLGEATVVEVLSDGRYRLARLEGRPFPSQGDIFAGAHLRIVAPEKRSA